jgi:uncharacterized protein (DUF697 family)
MPKSVLPLPAEALAKVGLLAVLAMLAIAAPVAAEPIKFARYPLKAAIDEAMTMLKEGKYQYTTTEQGGGR